LNVGENKTILESEILRSRLVSSAIRSKDPTNTIYQKISIKDSKKSETKIQV